MKKIFSILIMLLLFTSCDGKINANIVKTVVVKQESLSIDVFSLAFHKQIGSCSSQPILHRVLVFDYISLAASGDDYYAGTLEVVLDDNAGTYEALYKEVPALNNLDQSVFEIRLAGSFEIIKSVDPAENDKMILNNIGVVTPTISGSSVKFFIKLDADINRAVLESEAVGAVRLQNTSVIDNNCLL